MDGWYKYSDGSYVFLVKEKVIGEIENNNGQFVANILSTQVGVESPEQGKQLIETFLIEHCQAIMNALKKSVENKEGDADAS